MQPLELYIWKAGLTCTMTGLRQALGLRDGFYVSDLSHDEMKDFVDICMNQLLSESLTCIKDYSWTPQFLNVICVRNDWGDV